MDSCLFVQIVSQFRAFFSTFSQIGISQCKWELGFRHVILQVSIAIQIRAILTSPQSKRKTTKKEKNTVNDRKNVVCYTSRTNFDEIKDSTFYFELLGELLFFKKATNLLLFEIIALLAWSLLFLQTISTMSSVFMSSGHHFQSITDESKLDSGNNTASLPTTEGKMSHESVSIQEMQQLLNILEIKIRQRNPREMKAIFLSLLY